MTRRAGDPGEPEVELPPTDGSSGVRSVVRRLAAFGVDAGLSSLVVLVAATVSLLVLGPALRFGTPRPEPESAVLLDPLLAPLTAVIGVVAAGAYFCLAWWRVGATPGQRLLGLRVCAHAAMADDAPQVAADLMPNGAPDAFSRLAAHDEPDAGHGRLPLGRAVLRWLALGAPLWIAASTVAGWAGILCTLALVGWWGALLVSTARSATGAGVHDRISGTRVTPARARRSDRRVERYAPELRRPEVAHVR